MERFEESQPERNIERDRQSFLEAVSTIPVEEIPTRFDESAVESLMSNLENNKVFILGETHGVKENIDVIYTLFKKFGFRQLALEWKPELKRVAEEFLESGKLDFDAIQNSPDGRITAGHFALLEKLKTEGVLEGLVCYDGGSDGRVWNTRDAAMSRNILANLSHAPTLVVAGNLHTKTEAISFDDEPGEQHPMGEHVKRVIPDVASGKIVYIRGRYHNYGIQEFSELSENKEPAETRFFQDEGGLYVFEVPEAHAATVPNPHEKM